jgi:hypothetical protein
VYTLQPRFRNYRFSVVIVLPEISLCVGEPPNIAKI